MTGKCQRRKRGLIVAVRSISHFVESQSNNPRLQRPHCFGTSWLVFQPPRRFRTGLVTIFHRINFFLTRDPLDPLDQGVHDYLMWHANFSFTQPGCRVDAHGAKQAKEAENNTCSNCLLTRGQTLLHALTSADQPPPKVTETSIFDRRVQLRSFL